MRMTKWVLVALLVLLSVGTALAEAKLEGDASVGVYNKYIWRGYNLGGNADYLIQPEINLSLSGFSLGIWGNYNEDTEKLDEIDLTLEYSHDCTEQLSARVGHINYMLSDEVDSAEVYVGATLALPVDVDLELSYDYDELEAWFLTLGVSREIELSEKISLNIGATVGYNDFDYLNQGELTAGLNYAVNDAFTVTPAMLFSTPLSQDAEDADIDDEFVSSLTVTCTF